MASSRTQKDFEDNLRRCVENMGNNGAPALLDRSNGAFSSILSTKRVKQRVTGEKKSPHQGVIGKQQGRISKEQRRRSSKGNIKILPANESNFKALVFEHTCMPSPHASNIIVDHTSPLSPQSNSSVSTWGSLSQAAGGSMSQPVSPKTPQSKMRFLSQPTSPLSHSRPTSFRSENPQHASHNDLNFSCNFSTPCPSSTCNENGMPQCASASCLDISGHYNQAGWHQGISSSFWVDLETSLMNC